MLADAVLAHTGQPLQPHDAWWAWHLDPLIIVPLVFVAAAYVLGTRGGADTRAHQVAFGGAVVALVAALVSPLEAMAGTLVSAHMVQHVLLILVAAPLLAVSAPGASILRGAPAPLRGASRRIRRSAGLGPRQLKRLRSPVARWVLYVVTLWVWHASVVYGAAVEHEPVHLIEHASFLGTAFLVWSAILGPKRIRVPRGVGVLAVFTLGLQGTFLSALLTFAPQPWYADYLRPPQAWGLDPLADQQLAGVIMWVPAGFLHLGIALWLLASWLRETDAEPARRPATAPTGSATSSVT